MFITEEEKGARLSSGLKLESEETSAPDNLKVEVHQFRGRTEGATQIPDFLRPIIGASTLLSGYKSTQEAFGVKSTASLHAMAHGKTSPYGPEVPELKSKVDALVGNAQEKAAEKLLSALGLLTPEKLENVKAKDLSSIAADMSRIIEKTTPKQAGTAGTQILIYAPKQQVTEEKYEVIEVKQ